jgi:hypothetical protein
MAVRPDSLETPERGMELMNRGSVAAVVAGPPEEGDELRIPMARLELARRVEPSDKDLHCRDCFRRGRDAALRAIEEG